MQGEEVEEREKESREEKEERERNLAGAAVSASVRGMQCYWLAYYSINQLHC